MRVLIGIHPGREGYGQTRWVRRLRLANATYETMSVVEPVILSAPVYMGGGAPVPIELLRQLEEAASKSAHDAAERLNQDGLTSEACTSNGDPGQELMARAEKTGADLVVTGSDRKSKLGALFFGSVTRQLALKGKTSALIVKQEPPEGDLHLVFASDLSEYAQRAWAWLDKARPECIKTVTVLSMANMKPADFGVLLPDPAVFIEPDHIPKPEALREKMMETHAGLDWAETRYHVGDGEPFDELADEAAHLGGNIIAMGAQGHTFADQVFIGSVALHHTQHGDSTLLLIRP